jgi:Ni/Fe-hydrogenase 1 B-type cytochrome subunit
MTSNVATGPHDLANLKPVYVFEAPVRLWHWLHTLSFLVLAATGYLIANPLPSVGGEASDHFLMGNIRLIHFISGYVFAIGFAVRIYGEGLGSGSWADNVFGWITPILGGSEATHNWHNMAMWIMLTFVIIHIYMAVRADIVGRGSSVSTIINGWRLFKDDQP